VAKLSLIPAQAAIRTRLLADGTLTALLASATSIYDGVPDDAEYPYVVFGEKHSQPWDVFGKDGHDDSISIYVWSRALGDEECLTIASRINELLHGFALDVSSAGFSTVLLQLDMLDTMREPDGRTRKSVSRYKIMTQE